VTVFAKLAQRVAVLAEAIERDEGECDILKVTAEGRLRELRHHLFRALTTLAIAGPKPLIWALARRLIWTNVDRQSY